MQHGRVGDIWMGIYTDNSNIEPIYNLLINCKTMNEVKDNLLSFGFEQVDSRHSKGSSVTWVFADNHHRMIETYLFQGYELSITLKSHGFPDIKSLKRCWNFCDNMYD